MKAVTTMILGLAMAACSGHYPGLSPEAPGELSKAPIVLVKLESGAVLGWQKDRDRGIVERLEECLPSALAPVCPGVCEVRDWEDGEELQPHVVLTVKTAYSASAHFMYGFTLNVVYVMEHRAGTAELARFSFVNEPHDKVMADEGAPVDEVMTHDSVLTADRLCDELGNQADEIAAEMNE